MPGLLMKDQVGHEGLGPYPLFTRRKSDENVQETNFGEKIHKGSLRMNNHASKLLLTKKDVNVHIAKVCLEKALEKDPEYSSANYNLALILENEVGDLEKACSHYRQAVKIRSNFEAAEAGFQRTLRQLQHRKREQFNDDLRQLKKKFTQWGLRDHVLEFQALMRSNPGAADCLLTVLKEEAFMQEKAMKEGLNLHSLFKKILAECQSPNSYGDRLAQVLTARHVTQPLRISLKVIKMRDRFNLMELPKNHDSDLKPKQTVLFRLKRLSAFNPLSYEFEAFLQRRLVPGQPIFYVQTHKKQKTKKILESVLLFISFTSERESEDFLRACVKECLSNGVVKTMLTKERNYDEAHARALLKRAPWIEKDLEVVKKQHHFCLAE